MTTTKGSATQGSTTRGSANRGFHTFKPVGYWELVEHILGKPEGDWNDDWLSNLVYENLNVFMQNWEMEDSATGMGKEAVENAVREHIENVVQKSMALHRENAIRNALDSALEAADVPCSVTASGPPRYKITVSVDSAAMLAAWAHATEGEGYVAWDPSLKAKDIKDLVHLINILDESAEVYGRKTVRQLYDWSMDGFEPDTGTYSESFKIAEKANRKARRGK